ncbi:MAG: glycine C-acetyltransferase [Planctomycetota bacterium]
MTPALRDDLRSTLESIRNDGLYKAERLLSTPQGASAGVAPASGVHGSQASDVPDEVLVLCANNYLGLAQHPAIAEAARRGLDEFGFGLASVRFICGTQTIHKQLEDRISRFLQTDDTILYNSCFDANGGLFETLLGPEDAVVSDALNHASIIDGIRLCKAKRFRYANNDPVDLEAKLKEARDGGARHVLIATDGVFSMDGTIAQLDKVCDLADKYDALVMVDDCHATGFVGETGRGTHEHCGVMGRVDIITGTLGKALGGASGGFTSGRAEIVELLRQRSRPYLFSNTIAPPLVTGAMKAIELAETQSSLRQQLRENTAFFRHAMTDAGFDILPGEHPIVPVMLGDAALAARFADAMLTRGIYVIGFSYPVVPKGQARIRCQMSAAHTRDDLQRAVDAFIDVKEQLAS